MSYNVSVTDVTRMVLRFNNILALARTTLHEVSGGPYQPSLFDSRKRLYRLTPREAIAWKSILPIDRSLREGAGSKSMYVVNGRGSTQVHLFFKDAGRKRLAPYKFDDDYSLWIYPQAYIGLHSGQVLNAFINIPISAQDSRGRWIVMSNHAKSSDKNSIFDHLDLGGMNLWFKTTVENGKGNHYNISPDQPEYKMQHLALNHVMDFKLNNPIATDRKDVQVFFWQLARLLSPQSWIFRRRSLY